MSDIEDVGFNVRSSREKFFNVKIRSKISKLKLTNVKNNLIYGDGDSYVEKNDTNNSLTDDNCCEKSNCCKTDTTGLNDDNYKELANTLNVSSNTEFGNIFFIDLVV